MSTTHVTVDGQPFDPETDPAELADGYDASGNRRGAPGSPLRGLAAIRQQALQRGEVKRLKVSGYDVGGLPPLYVRYHKVDDQTYDRILGQAARDIVRKPGKGTSDGYADWLIAACDGIYLLDTAAEVIDPNDPHAGRERGPDPDDPDGELPKFDRRLRAMLGLPVAGGMARDAVRGLFFDRPGEITQHGDELARWMGFAGSEDTDNPS